MPLTVSDAERLKEIISRTRLVLVAVYNSSSPLGRYVSSLIDDFAFVVEPALLVVKVDLKEHPHLAEELNVRSSPRLLLYLDGTLIWEQIGFFQNYAADKYAIRRGILHALQAYGYKPKDFGLRLRSSLEEL